MDKRRAAIQTRRRRSNRKVPPVRISRLFAALLVGILAFGSQALAESGLQKILQNGKLRVGTTGDFNPMSFKDPASNTYRGYDIDVVTQLAKDMEVELELVPTDWKKLPSRLPFSVRSSRCTSKPVLGPSSVTVPSK